MLHYQFDTQGKLLRPLLVLLTSACVNTHVNHLPSLTSNNCALSYGQRHLENYVSSSQHRIAVITEMIHTASLIHDDLLDSAAIRRGKCSSYRNFGHREAILGGDFILTHSSRMLAQIGDTRVISVLAQVIEDLIHGEMMQLHTNNDDDQRFQVYLLKTYRKTASLIANSCKAVAMLTTPALSTYFVESIYQFGRHLGMAFQLIDDVLDYSSCEADLGKPSQGSDLLAGIATGPVLFAAQRYPELNTMLLRQFSQKGDKERAFELVHLSDGIKQTRMLAEFHFQAAERYLSRLKDSPSRKALLHVATSFIHRTR